MPKDKTDWDKTKPQEKNDITAFFHCKDCIEEKPDNISPREFIRVEVGWTKLGLQVWCVRHDKNIINLDFMGQKVKPI